MALRGRDDGVYFLDRADDLAAAVAAAARPSLRRRRDEPLPTRQQLDVAFSTQSDGFRSLVARAHGLRRAA